tara:strand:+ start:92 stop:1033 length:942 start_codon:yes stop_codon:yes gene_type:complete
LPAATVVEVQNLVKRYGDVVAVDNISLKVKKGKILSFLGPNGAGKTTTVEILECLRSPSSGIATVLGLDVSNSSDQQKIRQRIGVLPQSFNTFGLLTVKENIEYFISMFGFRKQTDADSLIRLVDLEDKKDAHYRTLSGGLKQRVGIAIALVNDPEVIFLDEPTSGLDPKARRGVWSVINGLRDSGKTVFLTTHYMEEAETLADSVIIINNGKIVAEGPSSELTAIHGGARSIVLKEPSDSIVKAIRAWNSNTWFDGNSIKITMNDGSDVAKIVDLAQEYEFDLSNMDITKPNLEDVFLRLTGRTITEDGGTR